MHFSSFFLVENSIWKWSYSMNQSVLFSKYSMIFCKLKIFKGNIFKLNENQRKNYFYRQSRHFFWTFLLLEFTKKKSTFTILKNLTILSWLTIPVFGKNIRKNWLQNAENRWLFRHAEKMAVGVGSAAVRINEGKGWLFPASRGVPFTFSTYRATSRHNWAASQNTGAQRKVLSTILASTANWKTTFSRESEESPHNCTISKHSPLCAPKGW